LFIPGTGGGKGRIIKPRHIQGKRPKPLGHRVSQAAGDKGRQGADPAKMHVWPAFATISEQWESRLNPTHPDPCHYVYHYVVAQKARLGSIRKQLS